jgi:diadenosine tetraphosphate (Ap4A) HIT family hydrolase
MARDARCARPPEAGMTEADCPLCRVVASLRDAETCTHPTEGTLVRKIADLPTSVALLGFDQTYRGYTLVVARRHATELFQLHEHESTRYFQDMLRVARAIANAFQPRKLNYELLGNSVPHLHWHVFPRYADDPDPLRPVWSPTRPTRSPTPDEAATTIAAIRRHL